MPGDPTIDHVAPGTTILSASRRLAYALRLEHARAMQASGASVWRTPRILPWGAWLREQWLLERARRPQAPAARLLTPGQAQALWDEVVARSAAAEHLLNTEVAAQLAARSWRRLHDWRIPLEALREYRNPEAQALYDWATSFADACRQHDALDEASLAGWAETSGFLPGEPLALAGFDLLVPAMRVLVDRWQAHVRCTVLPGASAAAGAVTVVGASDLDEEIELAARWARAQVEGGAQRVGVVVGDLAGRQAALRRVFEDVFTPGARCIGANAERAPFVLAVSRPLSTYPLVDAALSCLALAQGGASSLLAGRLLRTPFVRGAQREQSARALADARLRAERRERWDWLEMERWAGVTGCIELEAAARAANGLLRQYRGRATPSVWSERFDAVLRALGWPGERTRDSVEQQTLAKFQATLAELGALDGFVGALDLRGAVRRLRQLVAATRFEPETPPAPVTVIDATTVAGMRFDALWVAGLDSTHLPPPAAPDPLIPLELQRRAQMPEASAAATFALARSRLERLVHSAPHVVLSWPQREGDAELRRSPLLDGFDSLSPEALPTAPVRPLRERLFEARPELLAERDERAPPLATGTPRGGARIFELQSRCPFRAQAELRLGARPLEHVGPHVDPMERGKLVHRVLADVWAQLRDQATLAALDPAALERMVRESTERHAVQSLRPATRHKGRLVTLEIEGTTRQVLRLLAIDRARRPFTVKQAEQDERLEIEGITLRLQPDRIDALEEGGTLLIDYKLGAAHRASHWLDLRPGRPPAPQMPLYALAHARGLAGLAYAVLSPGAVEYRGWAAQDAIAPGIHVYEHLRRRPGHLPDWQSVLAHWETVLRQLARQYLHGEAQVDPLPQECTHCGLSILCRVHERPLAAQQEGEDEVVDE